MIDCKSAKVPLLSPETVVSKSILGARARSSRGPTQFNAYSEPWPKHKNVSSCAPGVFVRGEPSPVYRSTSKTPSKDKGCLPKTPYDPVKSLQKMRFTSALKKYRYDPKHSLGETKTSPYLPQVNSDDDTMDADVKSNGQSRRFQRWDPDEDDLLRFAIKQEKGNMHDWKAISEEFFGGVRSAHQVRLSRDSSTTKRNMRLVSYPRYFSFRHHSARHVGRTLCHQISIVCLFHFTKTQKLSVINPKA